MPCARSQTDRAAPPERSTALQFALRKKADRRAVGRHKHGVRTLGARNRPRLRIRELPKKDVPPARRVPRHESDLRSVGRDRQLHALRRHIERALLGRRHGKPKRRRAGRRAAGSLPERQGRDGGENGRHCPGDPWPPASARGFGRPADLTRGIRYRLRAGGRRRARTASAWPGPSRDRRGRRGRAPADGAAGTPRAAGARTSGSPR